MSREGNRNILSRESGASQREQKTQPDTQTNVMTSDRTGQDMTTIGTGRIDHFPMKT